MSGKHYFNIITMRVAKAIIRYNVSKVLMTLSSFLIDRKLRTAKVRLMPFYHIRSLSCAQEKGGLRAALFRESVKIKGDKGVEKPLGESGLYCEGGTESVHSLPSSSLLYHTNLVLQACLNMNFKLPLCSEFYFKLCGTSA